MKKSELIVKYEFAFFYVARRFILALTAQDLDRLKFQNQVLQMLLHSDLLESIVDCSEVLHDGSNSDIARCADQTRAKSPFEKLLKFSLSG